MNLPDFKKKLYIYYSLNMQMFKKKIKNIN